MNFKIDRAFHFKPGWQSDVAAVGCLLLVAAVFVGLAAFVLWALGLQVVRA